MGFFHRVAGRALDVGVHVGLKALGTFVGSKPSRTNPVADAVAEWSQTQSEFRRVVSGMARRVAVEAVASSARPALYLASAALTTTAFVSGAATVALGALAKKNKHLEFFVMVPTGLVTGIALVTAVGALLAAADPATSETAKKTVRGLLSQRSEGPISGRQVSGFRTLS